MDRLPGILKAYLEVTLKTTVLPDLTPLLVVPVDRMLVIHITPDNHQRKLYLTYTDTSNGTILDRHELEFITTETTVQLLTTPEDPNWPILEQFDSINFGSGFDIKPSYLAILRSCELDTTIARTAVELGLPGIDPHNPYETTTINL